MNQAKVIEHLKKLGAIDYPEPHREFIGLLLGSFVYVPLPADRVVTWAVSDGKILAPGPVGFYESLRPGKTAAVPFHGMGNS